MRYIHSRFTYLLTYYAIVRLTFHTCTHSLPLSSFVELYLLHFAQSE